VVRRKRLFYDIETSFNIIADFSCGYNKTIRPNQIIKEREIICVSYKWEGDDQVNSLRWSKKQSDKSLLKKFVKVMNNADQLVAHNGDRFDLRWIKSRCLYHGIETENSYRTVDTLKMARANLYMNSNKLDYLAGYFGIGSKTDTGGFDLWKRVCLDNDQEALDKMIEYCENDVVILEGVFHKLRKLSKANIHYGALWDGKKFTCPECGTAHVKMRKRYTTTTGVMRFNMRCTLCETSYTISGKQYQDLLNYKMLNNIK
jgi:predicted PolB exonuclease-like 3'-5' exonuclease